MATLIIVSGPSASGKSTLARRLQEDLGITLVSRDLIKEALFDSLGYSDRKRSIELGGAAALILLRVVADQLNANVSCIIEAKFNPKFSEGELRQLIEDSHCKAAQIQCVGDGSVLLGRFGERAKSGLRHPGHDEINNPDDFTEELKAGKYPLLKLGIKTLEYDTTAYDEVKYQQLLKEIRGLADPQN